MHQAASVHVDKGSITEGGVARHLGPVRVAGTSFPLIINKGLDRVSYMRAGYIH